MKKAYVFFVLTFIVNNLFAQELRVITTRFVGSDTACYASARYSISTNDGGVVFVGETNCFYGGGDIPASPSDTLGGGVNLLIGKLDSNLNVSWTKVYGGSREDRGISVAQTSNGGYGILGTTASTNRDISGMHGTEDMWLLKADASGNLLWQKCYGSTADEQASSIASTSDGGFIILGGSNGLGYDVPNHYSSSQFDYDWFIVKIDSLGNKQWSKSIGGTNDEDISGSILVANDGYYLVGSSASVDHDCVDNSWHPGVPTEYDYYVIKLDTSGNIVWAKSYGGSGIEHMSNAIIDIRDSSIVINGTTNMSNDYMVSGNHGSVDLWVVKVDKNGTLKWQKCLGSVNQEQGAGICSAIYGYTVYGSKIPGIISGYNDAWMFALDTAGNLLTDKVFGGTGTENPASMVPFKTGFAATGYSSSQSFTEGTSLGDMPKLRGQIYVSYINYWSLGIEKHTIGNDELLLHPNPASSNIQITLPNENGILNITNNIGVSFFMRNMRSSRSTDVDISEWPIGVYFVQWQKDDGDMQVKKFIKN